ncbi:MAG: MotA/TolQ/ExbB proton channel family protein [Leptolyngbya sp. DLM2.Bin15]|nr:MAG: MotA/TolQ/ExbB proton channel family protein [Leptolyngbya sp. DLM2.Bin15]
MNIPELFQEGGLAMWPLLVLSILALTTIIERIWFWSKILTREREIAGRVIEAARRDWQAAADIARRANDQPIGRFLYNALHLYQPVPEVFQLALETAADEELTAMRRGDKILEVVIALSPLLGLLGTVLGLMESLGSISLGDIGTTSTAGVTFGISRALITTATGLIIAIASLAFYRLFQSFIFGQSKIFRKAGNELELLYRKDWSEHRFVTSPAHPSAHPSHLAAVAVADVQAAQPVNGDSPSTSSSTDPSADPSTGPSTDPTDPSPSDEPSPEEPASEESSTY